MGRGAQAACLAYPCAKATKALLLLVLLLLPPHVANGAVDDSARGAWEGGPPKRVSNSNKNLHIVLENEMRDFRNDCLREIVSGRQGRECMQSEIAAENCAMRCVSTACYDSIYGADPLEEGEIDMLRGRDYRMCVRRELRKSRSASPTFFL